jgi:Ras association (RalGDS/AF-6) domain
MSFLTFTSHSRLDSNAEDEERRALIHSLFLAQQSSNERLEELEDECFLEDGRDTGSEYKQAASPLPFSPPIFPEELKRSLGKGVADRSQSSQSVHPKGKNSTRTSTLLNALLYQQEDSRERQRLTWSNLTDHRQSVIESDNLLQTWTNQRDPLAWEQASDNPKDDEEQEKSWHAGDNSTYKRPRSDSTALDTTNNADGEKSTSDKRNSLNLPEVAESTHFLPESHVEKPPPYQTNNSVAEACVRRSFRVGLEDTCRTIMPAVLSKYNIKEDCRDYLLHLVYMDGERLIRLEEKPLLVFKELDEAGKKPMLMLRRKSSWPVDKRAEASVVQPGSDEGWPEVASEWAPDSGDDLPEVAPKSDEGLPEVVERQLQRIHPLAEPIQSRPHPVKARSTESFVRSQQKLAKLTGLTYPIADAPELVETLSEINEPQPEAMYLYTEPDTHPRPGPIKVRSSEAVERSRQKLARLTGLSYIPQGGDASLDKQRNSTGSISSVNRSAMTSPSWDLDTFDGDGALLHKWITPPSAAQNTWSGTGFLPGPAPVRKMKQLPWGSRSPTDDTARNQVIASRMRVAGLI